jgi:hypothetical protein
MTKRYESVLESVLYLFMPLTVKSCEEIPAVNHDEPRLRGKNGQPSGVQHAAHVFVGDVADSEFVHYIIINSNTSNLH